MKQNIAPAEGKLGILIPGLGAVGTTMIAGVIAVNKGLSQPVGALTQMGNIRLGKRTENRYPLIKDFVPLANLTDIVFGGWDVYADNVFEAAANAKVLEPMLLHAVKPELEAIKPMKAVLIGNTLKIWMVHILKKGSLNTILQSKLLMILSNSKKKMVVQE